MRVKIQTLTEALSSPPGSSPYRAIIPLISWEVFQTLYDIRKILLDALQKYAQIYVLEGRHVIRLIKYGNYVDVERIHVDLFYIAYVPMLKGGEEVGMVEPHLWVLLLDGKVEAHEVRNFAEVKAVLERLRHEVKSNTVTVLQIENTLKDLEEELLKIALDSVERGVGYLRGLVADVIASLLYNVDKDVLNTFVSRLKEQWGPLLEMLDVKSVIVAEVKEVVKVDNRIAEKLEALEELGISLEER